MSKGFITGTNEELIKAYKESRDESYLKELIEANKGLINLLVSPYLTSIPNSELEDLTSESYIPMLRAIEDYDPEQGVAFSTLLKVYVRQHLNRLYNEATRQKRFTGTTPDSLDRLSEINKEGGTETDSTFEVECKDFSSVEFMDLLDSLQLNDKEQVAVNILMAGGAKAGTKKGEEFIQFLDNYQRYKECGKLLGTYIDKIPEVKCAKTNAVHTTYNQYGAKTGRFSSSDTVTKINLQNIPSHEKSIRKIFRARDGYKFVGGDFSQIEPRVLSYVSGDEAMQEAYREGKDLYAIMGSKVYGVPYEDCREFYPDGTVNAEGKHRRTTMKSVLLGIMYERGAKAIGEQFDKSAEWAQKLIDDFYKSFPKIQQLRLKVEKMAEEYGYVTTIQGRKRRLPEMQLPDHDDYRYQEAHRQSLNAVIQGSSADIMKLAMIAIYNDPQYKALDCHMVITVHDELIMEVPEDHIKEGADLLVNTMKRVGHSLIDLPMSVDAEVNDYWYGENLADDYLEEE